MLAACRHVPWCGLRGHLHLLGNRAEMELVLAPAYIEHDTYTLFACLMKDMKPFFVSDAYQRPDSQGRSQTKVREERGCRLPFRTCSVV